MFGQPKRLVEVHREGYAGGGLRMVMDAETGVHYLCVVGTGSGQKYAIPSIFKQAKK